MSNSLFTFIFGLTLGILISVSLVQRYQHHLQPIGSNNGNIIDGLGVKEKEIRYDNANIINSGKNQAAAKSVKDSTVFESSDPDDSVDHSNTESEKGPKLGNQKDIDEPVSESKTSVSSTAGNTASILPSQASLWVPGREGTYLKFKNNKKPELTTPSSLSSEKVINDGSRLDMKVNTIAGASSLKALEGDDAKNENESRDPSLGPLGVGQRGSGKRKRGRGSKGMKGSKDRNEKRRSDMFSVDKVAMDPSRTTESLKHNSGNSNSNDVDVQSRFFTANGDRIDPTSSSKGIRDADGILYTHPPLIPYHSQAHQDQSLNPPYVPSLSSVMTQRTAMISKALLEKNSASVVPKALPNMTFQKGIFEKENLKLHLCNGVFEAYSASYLTTRAHMMHVSSESYNLTWVNCEMASFIHMKEGKSFFSNPYAEGMIVQALDVLDFSVIHLSAYERSSKKYKHRIWNTKADQKTKWTKIEPVKEVARLLELKNNPQKSAKNITWSEEAKNTVIIMPFLGGAMGAGHSELGNRFDYLKACFWSFYEFFPHIVAGVSRKEDVDWCFKESGLPFYDVLLLENLPKGASLPVATTQRTKQKLKSGEWPFNYIFFTESDQILISRQLPMMFDHLKKYPGRMILPHRLMPYSKEVANIVHKKEVEKIELNKWMVQSCCMERQNCQDRKTWQNLAHPSVPVIDYYGLYVPLGNVNFLDERYRACTLTSYIGDYCP